MEGKEKRNKRETKEAKEIKQKLKERKVMEKGKWVELKQKEIERGRETLI